MTATLANFGQSAWSVSAHVIGFHPAVQMMYMSGYADDFPEAQLPANSTILQKPFRFAALLEELKLSRNEL